MPAASPPARDLRAIALPTEHGGWGFLLEPILLGLLVAPTLAGVCLALATATAFLLRQPLKIIWVDRRRGRHTPRTRMATQVAAGYALVAAAGFALAFALAGPPFLAPLLMAAPLGAVFLYYDLSRPGRTLQAELAAPLALAFVAPSMAVLDGWLLAPALALWLFLAARSVPAILYVRARLRLDRGRPVDVFLPLAAHAAAVVIVLPAAALLEASHWLVTAPYMLLLLRAVWLLAPNRPALAVKTIGFMELGLGIFTVVMVALAVR